MARTENVCWQDAKKSPKKARLASSVSLSFAELSVLLL